MLKTMQPQVKFAPFSRTALKAIFASDRFVNIFEGAVRSSKTVSSIIAWLRFIEESPHTQFLMTGKTSDTLYRNVIDGPYGILSILGEQRAQFIKGAEGGSKLLIKVPDRRNDHWVVKTCYCVGANDEKAEGKIRGLTVAGWYADEVTLYPESFVKQALNRMSLDGARAFWTCNPDSPYHFIKTEFIDKAKEKGYRVFHFTLDDNLALSERYKEEIKKAYSGLWYKRMILGLWVMADGVVYDMFDHRPEEEGGMVVDKLPPMRRYWVGIDYGTSNPTTFILCGLGEDDRFYVIDEYYYSGAEIGRSKSPKMFSDDLRRWLEEHRYDDYGNRIEPQYIFVDPSAEGFIVQLWSDGIRNIVKADNDVKKGIELVSTVMTTDRFRVHRRCRNTLRELASYVWDPRAQRMGEDRPLKQNDHCLDPIRYIIYSTRVLWQPKVRNRRR